MCDAGDDDEQLLPIPTSMPSMKMSEAVRQAHAPQMGVSTFKACQVGVPCNLGWMSRGEWSEVAADIMLCAHDARVEWELQVADPCVQRGRLQAHLWKLQRRCR
jgi:hypothetical protein